VQVFFKVGQSIDPPIEAYGNHRVPFGITDGVAAKPPDDPKPAGHKAQDVRPGDVFTAFLFHYRCLHSLNLVPDKVDGKGKSQPCPEDYNKLILQPPGKSVKRSMAFSWSIQIAYTSLQWVSRVN